MVITYLGDGCFRLQSGERSLLIDPSGNRLKADAVVKTAVNPAEPPVPEEAAFAGEYEIKGIEIEGAQVDEESTAKLVKTAYRINWEDISVGVLGGLTSVPSAAVLEKLGEPDILLLPVEEDHFLEPEAAGGLVRQLSPAVVIPSLYNDKSVKALAKELGQSAAVEDRFTFKKKDLTPEAMKLVVLGAKA